MIPRRAKGAEGLWPWATLVVLCLFLALKMSPLATTAKWDECAYVYDAQRVLEGQAPYRDFFNFVPPGTFWAQAFWYWLFGGRASLTLGRLLAGLTAVGSSLILYRLLTRAGWRRPPACLWAGAYTVALYGFWAVPSHHWFANFFILASLLALEFPNGVPRSPSRWLFAGLCTGVAGLFLQTTGLEALVLWGALLLVSGRPFVAAGARYAAGVTAVGLPVLLWAWVAGAMGPMMRDVLFWTGESYGREGGPNAVGLLEDWPDRLAALWSSPPPSPVVVQVLWALLSSLALVGLLGLALLLSGAALWVLGKSLRMRSFPHGLMVPALALVAVEAALFSRGKTDWLHLLYGLGPVGAVWLMAAGPWEGWGAWWRKGAKGLVLAAFAGSLVLHSGRLLTGLPEAWEFWDVDRPVREAPVNRWLRAQPWLLKTDRIVVFPEGGEVYLYVRPAAVGFTQFLPLSERLNGPRDQAEVADQMRTAKPRCVLLTVDREKDYLDPASPVGLLLLSDYGRLTVVSDAVVYLRRAGP